MISDSPLVSVLMTAYNREKFIAGAIESVLSSTYHHWELIIVDDSSKDRTAEIARTYEAKDKRVKVYVNDTNLGDYPNRNRAASYAQGKYLKYLDSDDLIYPHGLQVMVEAMELFPEAGMGTPYHKEQDVRPYPYLVGCESSYKEFFINEDFLTIGPSGVIIKRSLFEEVGGFSGKRYVGDTEMWLTLAAVQPVVKFQCSLFWWRQHETQEFKKGQTAEGYYSLNYITMKELLLSERCPMKDADKKMILARLNKRQSRFVLSMMLKKFNYKDARYVMNACSLSITDVFKYSFLANGK